MVCGDIIPGALPIFKGTVPVLARGLGHTVPTYVVGSRDRKPSTANAARLLVVHQCRSRPDAKIDLYH